MSDVFENAIISIQLGIEDFRSNDERRPISALRNFYAGVLLLGKQCLLNAAPVDVDPMAVLASKFIPALDDDSEITYEAKGQQTIDLNELKDRFKAFKLHWPAGDINKLQKLRNDFEHYHSNAPKEAIRQAIADCFPMVEGFFTILGKAPKAELGETWDLMLEEKAFFDKLKTECDASFQTLPWWSDVSEASDFECPNCGSSLICQEDAANNDPTSIAGRCKACGEKLSAESTIEVIVQGAFGLDHVAIKDGEEPAVHDCPECGQATYVEVGDIARCFFCDYAIEGECARCSEQLTISTISFDGGDLCAYCDHVMSKDD